MKVVSVVGARPQFVKAAAVSRVLGKHYLEVLVHTGQHYDDNMSGLFFRQLGIPDPAYNLGVGSGTHGHQTGQMLAGLEEVLLAEKPDWALVYGDTNSTLAGALAAVKLHIAVGHVEAGLRSFNRQMPEEINRVVADHVSDVLFVPTPVAMKNLEREGLTSRAHLVGDVMVDALLHYLPTAQIRSRILDQLGLPPKGYYLLTVHRAENTDDFEKLARILDALDGLDAPVIFPIHPRTQARMEQFGLGRSASANPRIRFLEPVGYLDMLILEQNARVVLTDSGGVQKEAYLLGVPAITLREETEWPETVEANWNVLAGTDPKAIVGAVGKPVDAGQERPPLFGDGRASQRIVDILTAG